MTRTRPLVIIAALALAACTTKDSSNAAAATGDTPVVAAAPATSNAEPTAEDISNYPLDMDKMRKWATTMKYLGEAAQSDSTIGDAARMGNNESTNQTIARLEANATTRAALRKAGWSAKDYVWTTAAFLQAGMMQGVLASTKDAKLPAGHSPKNIEFLRAHQREIDKLGEEMGTSSN
jgi:hypothetical protein